MRLAAVLDGIHEQDEAKRLLEAALREEPAHAYLLHGPPGVGKRRAALAFAGELLGDRDRVERMTHPDLYLLEPLGDQIRIDDIRLLHHDLHMRPFEADRRVYLILSAHVMNEDAADALLKDLEEPPPYAVLLLVADELGPLPETIRSRCQLVPFRRLPERAVRAEIAARAPGLSEEETTALARVAGGRLDRAGRLLDPKAAAESGLERLELPAREAEQRVRRAQRGAEREELLLTLEELAAWYRDLVVVDTGAEGAVIHYDRLDVLREDASGERSPGAERAAELVRDTWRSLEEFNLHPGLALEALFIRLRRE